MPSPGLETVGTASLSSNPWPHSWSNTEASSPVLEQTPGAER
jgi:hypothetical protein